MTATIDPAVTGPAHRTDDSKKAARQLEAFFLRRLLAEARPQGGAIDGGFAGDTFKQMLDEAVADKMADAGGLGLAKMFEGQLEKGTQVAKPGANAAISALSTHSGGNHAVPAVAHPMPPARDPQVAAAAGADLDRPFVVPVIGRQSSAYGMRTHPVTHATSMHSGLDIAAPTGTPVKAAAAGIVTHAGPAGTYGNLITIKHADGVETRYAHLSAVTVTQGTRVDAGTEVGKVGSTGLSTGPHLHFELRRNGKLEDPANQLPLNSYPTRANR